MCCREMTTSSLRLNLLLWVLCPLAALMILNVWISYDTAHSTAQAVTDRTLKASAQAIIEQAAFEHGELAVSIPPISLKMHNAGQSDRVYYRVQSVTGALFTGQPDLPLPSPMPEQFQAISYEAFYHGQKLRLIALLEPVAGDTSDQPLLVVVGVTLNGLEATTKSLWSVSAAEQIGLMICVALFIVIGLGRGLAPLQRLRDALLVRSWDDLSPITLEALPVELEPMLSAINQSFVRVHEQISAQRRFIANAAHQIKTPMALFGAQLAFLQRATSAEERSTVITALQSTIQQTGRLVGQLLMLSRIESAGPGASSDPVEICAVTRQVLEDLLYAFLNRQIDLGLDPPAQPVMVQGNALVLREMIVNLVENALRYTPDCGKVDITILPRSTSCLLVISDTGPGIPPDQRALVFERFYRVPGAKGDGSGLGLAIVKEILAQLGGEISLQTPETGIGLAVHVTLPLHPSSLQSNADQR